MRGARSGPGTAARTLVVAAAVAAAGACGGDFTGSDGELREGEAAEMATVIARQASRVMVAQVEEAPDPTGGVEISSQVLFDRGAACPQGGSASVTGTVARRSEVGDDRLTLDFRASLVHDSCAVRLGDRTVTLTGAPGVTLDAVFERDAGAFAGPQEASLRGRLQWSAGDAPAIGCAVNLETTLSQGGDSLAAAGEVCGFEVDRTFGVSPPAAGRSRADSS